MCRFSNGIVKVCLKLSVLVSVRSWVLGLSLRQTQALWSWSSDFDFVYITVKQSILESLVIQLYEVVMVSDQALNSSFKYSVAVFHVCSFSDFL